ncbi:hypothetical protein [Salininema proteolyticum]|uniref:FtsX-like permease family protein n=1 Tax=Salininema proteolyticum TaxID=1607685 RepID=A0ABV8TXA3_9ACTN
MLIALGESWRPTVLGTLAAAGVLAVAAIGEVPLPITGFILTGADIRAALPLLAAALAGSLLLLMSLSLFLLNRRSSGRDPSSSAVKRGFLFHAASWAFPVFAVTVIVIPWNFQFRETWAILTTYIAQAGVLLTIAPAMSSLSAWIGRRMFARKQSDSPSAIVGGTRLSAYPKSASRQIAGIAGAFFVMFFALAYQDNFSDGNNLDRIESEHVGREAAMLRFDTTASAEDINDYLDALPSGAAFFGATTAMGMDARSDVFLTGTCETWEAVGTDCSAVTGKAEAVTGDSSGDVLPVDDDRVRWWVDSNYHGFGDDSLTLKVGDPAEAYVDDKGELDGGFAILAVSTDGDDLPLAAFKAQGTGFPTGVDVGFPAGASDPQTTPLGQQSLWLVLFGIVALVLLTMASAFASAGEFLRQARALAPIGVLTGGIATFRATSSITVLVPLFLGAVVGIGIGGTAGSVMLASGGTLFRAEVLVPTLSALLVSSLAMWWWSSSVAIREARRWRPGRGD